MVIDFRTETFVAQETDPGTRLRDHLDGRGLTFTLRRRYRNDWAIEISASFRFS